MLDRPPHNKITYNPPWSAMWWEPQRERPAIVTITGGTGSFGRALTQYLLAHTICSIRVVNRTEPNHWAMRQALPPSQRLTYILADIRDEAAMRLACHGAGYVVHAAALKVVGTGEENPGEVASVNVDGTATVIRAAHESGVERLLMVSTDKAVQPINAYGATKMLAERLVIQANKTGSSRNFKAACIRGGNIWASRGSVAEKWHADRAAARPLVVNGEDTTRFHLLMPDWIDFAWLALNKMHGGEVFVPKAAAWRLGDLAGAFGGPVEQAARRAGDKPEETLYSQDEAERTRDIGWGYVVEPPADLRAVWDYAPWDGRPVACAPYTSGGVRQLTTEELIALVKELG